MRGLSIYLDQYATGYSRPISCLPIVGLAYCVMTVWKLDPSKHDMPLNQCCFDVEPAS